MNYDYITGIIGDYPLPMMLTFYFLFLTLFGDMRIKISSFVVFLSSLFILVTADYDFSMVGNMVSNDTYTQDVGISVLWDGVTALIIIMFVKFDDYAIDQSILLIFATACHIMVLSGLLSDRTGIFFIWYDELIITIGILQIMVSYDGFIHALSNLQSLLLRAYTYCNRTIQNLPLHKDSGKRS